MAFQTTNGAQLYLPGLPFQFSNTAGSLTLSNTSNTVMTSTNTTAKTAMLGRVFFDVKSGSKNIARVHWRFGSTITAGTSAVVRVSVQGVTGGSKGIPDGTIAQSGNAYYIFNMSDAGVTASTWFNTPGTTAFGTKPVVNFGDLISVVWDWSAAGTGAVLTFSNEGTQSGGNPGFSALLTTPDATTWTDSGFPNVVLEFDDGTFGTLDGSFLISNAVSTTYGATSAATSYGNQFTLPYTAKVDALYVDGAISSGSSGVMELVNATSGAVISSVTLSNNYNANTSGTPIVVLLSSEQTLAANTAYFVGLRATSGTTTGCTMLGWDINSPSHQSCIPGGTAFASASRSGSTGVPTTTNTRRYVAGVRISAIDDGTGTGGGTTGAPFSRIRTGM